MSSLDKMEGYDRLKQERDEAVALVEVMREALTAQRRLDYTQAGSVLSHHIEECERLQELALSLTGPDALREIQARTLREAADKYELKNDAWGAKGLREMAEAILKGE